MYQHARASTRRQMPVIRPQVRLRLVLPCAFMYRKAGSNALTGRKVATMPIKREAREQLASLMDSRLRDLRLRWQDVAIRGGVSIKSLHNARTGSASIRPRTQWGIEAGLQWPPGFVEWVLGGHDPAGFTGGETVQPAPVLPPLRAVPPPEPAAPPEVTIPADMAAMMQDGSLCLAVPVIYTRARAILDLNPEATGRDIFPGETKAPKIWDLCRDAAFTLDECALYAAAGHLEEERRKWSGRRSG